MLQIIKSKRNLHLHEIPPQCNFGAVKLILAIAAIAFTLLLCVSPVVADDYPLSLDIVSNDWIEIADATALLGIEKSGNYYLSNNISISSTWMIHDGMDITLNLSEHDITRTGSGSVINVTSGAKLTIIDTIGEGKITGGNTTNGGGVYVLGDFTLAGGNITGNIATNRGGGVYVTHGNFTLSRGNVTGNIAEGNMGGGGGVYVTQGNFTQLGGNVTGNKAQRWHGGGIYVDHLVEFKQYGGNVTGNTAQSCGGGVYLSGGNFIQSCGNITGNTAYEGGGVAVGSGSFTQTGGNVNGNTASNHGGGIYVDYGNVIQLSGYIIGNTASDRGGGIYVNEGTFTQSGGNVTGNKAVNGGGVYAYYSNITQIGGNITCNNATDDGGGVYINGDTFTQSGGNMTGNEAKRNGGGVYVAINGNFTQMSGNVTGNNASEGGGVYVSSLGTFEVSGDAVVDGVYLHSGKVINLNGTSFNGSVKNINGDNFEVNTVAVIINSISPIKASDIATKFKPTYEYLSLWPDDSNKKLVVDNTLKGHHPAGECLNATDGDGSPVPVGGWRIWRNTTALPDKAGNYVLDVNVSLTKTWSVPIGKTNLCLNGHVIKQTVNWMVISISNDAELVLYDCDNETKHYFDKNAHGLWVLNDTNTTSIYNVTGGVITGGNNSNSCGGVEIYNSKFTMYGGNIVGNSAGVNASGVSIYKGNFTLKGGNIVGNSAGVNGGGVYVTNDGNFTQVSGNVTGNKATNGGGVYVERGDFTMSCDATVDETNEVYLLNNKIITVDGDKFTGHAMNITGSNLIDGAVVVKIADNSFVLAEDIVSQFRLANLSKTLIVGSDGKTLVIRENHPPKIASAALSLGNDIAVRFIVLNSSLAGYHDANLSVVFNGTTYTPKPVGDPANNRVVFTFKNISPAMMNETMIATLYATEDAGENALAFDTREYSVKKYCTNMLEKYNAKNNLTTLCVDLLNYGSAAQVYTGETDSTKLVNYTLNVEQAGWASKPVTPRDDFKIIVDGSEDIGKWRAAALNLYSDISVIFKFTLGNEIDTSKLKAVVTYGQYGDKTTNITKFKDAKYDGWACKSFTFSNMNALELNYPIKVKLVYEDGVGKESDTIQYSVDAYCHSKSSGGGVLEGLVRSIVKYTRAVAAYVGVSVDV